MSAATSAAGAVADRACVAETPVVTSARAREADIADLPEADVEAGLRFERPVERDGIFVDLPDRVAEVEERQEPRREEEAR